MKAGWKRGVAAAGVTAALGAAALYAGVLAPSGANGQTTGNGSAPSGSPSYRGGHRQGDARHSRVLVRRRDAGRDADGGPEERRRGEESDRRDQGGRRRGERRPDADRPPPLQEDGTNIVGYTAVNTVNEDPHLGKAGEVVDAAVKAGANQVYGRR